MWTLPPSRSIPPDAADAGSGRPASRIWRSQPPARPGPQDVLLDPGRRVRGRVAPDHLAIAAHQEFGEVPLDALGAEDAGLRPEPAVQRVRVGAVDLDLGVQREADVVLVEQKARISSSSSEPAPGGRVVAGKPSTVRPASWCAWYSVSRPAARETARTPVHDQQHAASILVQRARCRRCRGRRNRESCSWGLLVRRSSAAAGLHRRLVRPVASARRRGGCPTASAARAAMAADIQGRPVSGRPPPSAMPCPARRRRRCPG